MIERGYTAYFEGNRAIHTLQDSEILDPISARQPEVVA
jgi:hypothetical protein